LSIGLDKSQVKSTRKSILALTSVSDIRQLNDILHKEAGPGRFNGEARLLVEEAKGEQRIFVDTNGVVMEGKRQYKLKPTAFQELKQFLGGIYHEPSSK